MATDKNDFYQERNRKTVERIENLKEELPAFADEFFIGIENQTSVLTRLNYAYDLRIFFDFLCKKKFKTKTPQELTLRELDTVSSTDIEKFVS